MVEDEHLLGAARRGLFEQYAARGASVWVQATGTSMLPSIADGALMLVDFGAREPRLGQIAVFARGELIIGHRVVRRRRRGRALVLTTKGDSARFPDAPVAAGELLGVVRAVRSTPEGAPATRACSGARAVWLALRSTAAWQLARLAAGGQRRLGRRRPAGSSGSTGEAAPTPPDDASAARWSGRYRE